MNPTTALRSLKISSSASQKNAPTALRFVIGHGVVTNQAKISCMSKAFRECHIKFTQSLPEIKVLTEAFFYSKVGVSGVSHVEPSHELEVKDEDKACMEVKKIEMMDSSNAINCFGSTLVDITSVCSEFILNFSCACVHENLDCILPFRIYKDFNKLIPVMKTMMDGITCSVSTLKTTYPCLSLVFPILNKEYLEKNPFKNEIMSAPTCQITFDDLTSCSNQIFEDYMNNLNDLAQLTESLSNLEAELLGSNTNQDIYDNVFNVLNEATVSLNNFPLIDPSVITEVTPIEESPSIVSEKTHLEEDSFIAVEEIPSELPTETLSSRGLMYESEERTLLDSFWSFISSFSIQISEEYIMNPYQVYGQLATVLFVYMKKQFSKFNLVANVKAFCYNASCSPYDMFMERFHKLYNTTTWLNNLIINYVPFASRIKDSSSIESQCGIKESQLNDDDHENFHLDLVNPYLPNIYDLLSIIKYTIPRGFDYMNRKYENLTFPHVVSKDDDEFFVMSPIEIDSCIPEDLLLDQEETTQEMTVDSTIPFNSSSLALNSFFSTYNLLEPQEHSSSSMEVDQNSTTTLPIPSVSTLNNYSALLDRTRNRMRGVTIENLSPISFFYVALEMSSDVFRRQEEEIPPEIRSYLNRLYKLLLCVSS